MAELTLAQAATLVGKSKSTLTRAIKSGRMSAIRRADGTFGLDPAEVLRVYPDAVLDAPHDASRNEQNVASDAVTRDAQQAEINALRVDLAVASALAEERARALDAAERNLADLRRLLPAPPAASAVRPWWRFWK